jgi:hypothetical protein
MEMQGKGFEPRWEGNTNLPVKFINTVLTHIFVRINAKKKKEMRVKLWFVSGRY